ncbi:MAG: hypothetical protein FJX44_06465 [Alphaproteobacteria bacterium]|nr:hypothetical protein [Alphaproteobacteria bacterium]
MVSTRIKLSIIATLAFAVVAGSVTTEAISKNKTGAVVGGLIAGAAIGAAISSANHPTTVYVEERPKPNKWSDSFSPKPGIRCYPAQHACYSNDGAYNANWTHKVYAR